MKNAFLKTDEILDCYKILGLNPSSSKDEIKQTFHKIIKKTHPDIVGKNKENVSQIIQAYKTLITNENKIAYKTNKGEQENSRYKTKNNFSKTQDEISTYGKILCDKKESNIQRIYALRKLKSFNRVTSYRYLKNIILEEDEESILISTIEVISDLKIYQSIDNLTDLFFKSKNKIIKTSILKCFTNLNCKKLDEFFKKAASKHFLYKFEILKYYNLYKANVMQI